MNNQIKFKESTSKYEKEYRLADLFDQIYNKYRNTCYTLKLLVGTKIQFEQPI